MFRYKLLLTILFVVYVKARPNILLVLTDDQDVLLNGLLPMESTLRRVANRGKTFENAFVNTPRDCPSRSTILTGKYAHNTGVRNNSIAGNCSSKDWQEYQEPYTIPSYLLNSTPRYNTFHAGVYLNQYGTEEAGGTLHSPKGYGWWVGLVGDPKYYNFTLSVNRIRIPVQFVYLTDTLVTYSVNFLNGKKPDPPFLMILTPPAPHAPFTPAERHESEFPNVTAVRSPSFKFAPTDKHWLVGLPPTHLPEDNIVLDDIHRRRLQSLLAVDEMLSKVLDKMEDLGVLNNTYIIFTSDNGFHIGQFTQPWGNRQPYETDIRVPLIISGPGIPWGGTTGYPVSTVDLAPTILDLAGLEVPADMDGTSFKDVLFSEEEPVFEKRVFVEYWGESNMSSIDEDCRWLYSDNVTECTVDQWCKCQDSKNNTYTCVINLTNSQQFKFCRFKDDENFVEAYNITLDPYELENIYKDMEEETVEYYSNLLDEFEKCAGASCVI